MTDSASQSLVELKPCPFCGGMAKSVEGSVMCDGVGCPVICGVPAQGFKKYDPVAIWNTRAPDPVAAARITELEAERDRIERNRDMWKGQCERQAESLTTMRDLLTRVDGLGRTNAWRRMPAGGLFIATSLGQDIAVAIRSLPPLAKRGEQKSRERSNPPAEQSTTLPQQLTEN